MTTNTMEVIYKLEGVEAENGVDIFEIAPILMQFGELIKSANDVLGYEQKIEVKVKPFKQGSWITEFIFNPSTRDNLLALVDTPNGQALTFILPLLGLNAKDGIVGVATIIRKTRGIVTNFKKNSNGKVVYETPDGGKLTVSNIEHKLIQSPIIQNNYYNSVISPLEKIPAVNAVEIGIGSGGQRFTNDDISSFGAYFKTELLEDVDENISTMSGIYLKPKRGPYSGDEQAYSFIMGDNNVLWPVTIEDEQFLGSLKSGEIRPYSEDVLKVNLEVRQKKDASNRIQTHYAIIKVIEYIKYEKPRQLSLNDVK